MNRKWTAAAALISSAGTGAFLLGLPPFQSPSTDPKGELR